MQQRLLQILATLVLFCSCSYNDFDDSGATPHDDSEPWIATHTIDELQPSLMPIADGVIVEGVVQSSDSAGNFYKEIIIAQSDTTAPSSLRLTFNFYELFSLYAVGQPLAIDLSGLVVGSQDGMLCAGYKSNDAWQTIPEPIPTPYIASEIIHKQGKRVDIDPIELTIEELRPSLVGRRVVLRDAYFTNQYGTYSGERELSQMNSPQTIYLYTSPYSIFAGDATPLGILQIEAIVAIYDDKIQLKINSPEDITTTSTKYKK